MSGAGALQVMVGQLVGNPIGDVEPSAPPEVAAAMTKILGVVVR